MLGIINLFITSTLVSLLAGVLLARFRVGSTNRTWDENSRLLLRTALRGGTTITILYLLSLFFLRDPVILKNPAELFAFTFLALGWAFANERWAIRRGKNDWRAAMPKILGVGVAPLLLPLVSGIASFAVVALR